MSDAKRLRCPIHGIPDCSPLLNGCSWRPGTPWEGWLRVWPSGHVHCFVTPSASLCGTADGRRTTADYPPLARRCSRCLAALDLHAAAQTPETTEQGL